MPKDRTCLVCGDEYESWERNMKNEYHPNGEGKCSRCAEEYIIVEIPTRKEHEGFYKGKYKIKNKCPICGNKRGFNRWKGYSFDGSRKMIVDCWSNECDHVDFYKDIRKEGVLL